MDNVVERPGIVVTERPNGTRRHARVFDPAACPGDVSLTKQQYKKECDINYLMKAYKKRGILPPMINREAMYADVSAVGDYVDVQRAYLRAEADFMSLPSAVRKRFDNTPGKLIEFLSNPANKDEAIELGLVSGPPVEPPPVPAVVDPTPPQA